MFGKGKGQLARRPSDAQSSVACDLPRLIVRPVFGGRADRLAKLGVGVGVEGKTLCKAGSGRINGRPARPQCRRACKPTFNPELRPFRR